MHRFRLIVGCVALSLMVFGAACSSDSSDLATKDPKAAMKAASNKTVSAGTVKLALSAKDKLNAEVLSGNGAYDFDKKQGRFTLKTKEGVGADMVITAERLYLKVPTKNAGDKEWVGVSASADDSASPDSREAQIRQYLDSIRQQVDPRSTLDALGANVPDLKKVGSQKIRGTNTTHLAGRVDLSENSIRKAPADKREGLRQAREAFGSDGYPVDVWLDGDGRVRRVEYVLEGGTGATATKTTVRLDLFDFGGNSGIVVPPESEVGDAASLFPTTTSTTVKK